jgi:hypothetical protein
MKQLLILLFIMGTFSTSTAQNPARYMLKGIVSVKGAENQNVKNVSVKIDGGNTRPTDNSGYFALDCGSKKVGDKVTLQVIATGYVVLSLNGMIKPDKKNTLEVVLSTDTRPISIEIQKESELKSDYEQGLTTLKTQIATQNQILKTLSAKAGVTNAELVTNKATREKVEKDLQVVLSKLDSIGKSVKVNGFLPILEQIDITKQQLSATLSQLEITIKANQAEIMKGLDELTERDDKTKFKLTGLSDDAFNRWNIIGKTNITPTVIRDDKIIINLDIDKTYQGNPLLIKLIWNGQNRELVGGIGDGISFEPTKTLTWQFSKEGLKKESILTGNKLNIFVYSKYNMPIKKGMGWEIAVTGVGLASSIYGLILRNRALSDYEIYKSKTDENDAVYTYAPTMNRRNGVFEQANKAYGQSPYFGYIGGAVAATGLIFLVKKIKWNKAVKDARRKSMLDFVPDTKRVIVAPISSPSGSLGLGIGIKY